MRTKLGWLQTSRKLPRLIGQWVENRHAKIFVKQARDFIREPILRISRRHKNRELACSNQLRDKIVDGAPLSSEVLAARI
jgi:hypothetical protein